MEIRKMRIHSFGESNVLQADVVEPSLPDASQVLVSIRATRVNPVDFKNRNGKYPAVRIAADSCSISHSRCLTMFPIETMPTSRSRSTAGMCRNLLAHPRGTPANADKRRNGTFVHPRRFFCRVGKAASRCHARDDSNYHSDFIADRRAADVAIQYRLGILPWRWTRPDPHYCPCPCSRRPIVTERPAAAGRLSSNRSYRPLWLWSDD